ncbi:MAG: phosphate butyryltransferase [Clostridiales Family XIII bacterium]|jgi:phosphate butyryltransferase|nr:phosphate butyryltransferase [Clostridiales Family XIII bacterium]
MKKISDIFDSIKATERRTIAVASAQSDEVLTSVRAAYDEGIVNAVLVGDRDKIHYVASRNSIDISPFELVEAPDDETSADIATRLVSQGDADMIMKGLLPTPLFLKAILNPEKKLRNEDGLITALPFFEVPQLDRLLFISDPGFIPAPDLETKKKMIEIGVSILRKMKIDTPKVALVCAAETVSPKIPSTVDAKTLEDLNKSGEIKNCIVGGPMSLDLAISETSAEHKGYHHPIAGKADLLIAPNIEAANIFYKAMTYLGGYRTVGLMVGAAKPIIMTSRTDSAETKLNTIAIAVYLAGAEEV